MLADEVTIRLEAGKGGKGAVAFNKVRLMQGPTGGDGGHGGNIYFEGVPGLHTLAYYVGKPAIRSESGKDGRGQFLDGRRGEDLVLKVPVGTRVINTETGFTRDIDAPGERFLAAGGGKGGRGNFKFRSGENTSPKEVEEGKEGDVTEYRLEMRLIADVGLIGLPNAGKSSLLNELTNAKSKVGNYAFTTLEPNLGDFYGLIIADIPGLIEGASEGKGLGVKFLKHIERTKTLFHLISAESDDVLRDYRAVRAELVKYNPALGEKQERVLLTKIDAVTKSEVEEKLAALRAVGLEATPVSILEPESMESVRTLLRSL